MGPKRESSSFLVAITLSHISPADRPTDRPTTGALCGSSREDSVSLNGISRLLPLLLPPAGKRMEKKERRGWRVTRARREREKKKPLKKGREKVDQYIKRGERMTFYFLGKRNKFSARQFVKYIYNTYMYSIGVGPIGTSEYQNCHILFSLPQTYPN